MVRSRSLGDTTREDRRTVVSVVMPVRNEADFIERSLGAVLAQDYPADRMEILVVERSSIVGSALYKPTSVDRTDFSGNLLNAPGDRLVPQIRVVESLTDRSLANWCQT